MSPSDSFQDMQPLPFALATVTRYLALEFVDSKSDKFETRTRKRLFDLLITWCDETVSTWSQESSNAYRREIERYKSGQRIEQLEGIQWPSMNSTASLLYGPYFDDNARKMSGWVILWINSLLMDSPPRPPFG